MLLLQFIINLLVIIIIISRLQVMDLLLLVVIILTGGNRKDGSASRCETVGKLHRRPFWRDLHRKNKSMVSSGRLLLQLSVDMQR